MARILVVDDDKNVFEIIRYTMEQEGHTVQMAANGKEGLARAAADRPDLIILDIMMPEMDGYTLNTLLAAQPGTKNIPVIVLTAKGQMRDTFVSAPNVQSYMDKPFEPSALQEQIRIVLAKKIAK
jgi:two-component system alkaline phosphatase synthesis response regulator PhoP